MYHIYDFYKGHPERTAFDIKDCFSFNKEYKTLMFLLEGKTLLLVQGVRQLNSLPRELNSGFSEFDFFLCQLQLALYIKSLSSMTVSGAVFCHVISVRSTLINETDFVVHFFYVLCAACA